jgi:hypothetical protein
VAVMSKPHRCPHIATTGGLLVGCCACAMCMCVCVCGVSWLFVGALRHDACVVFCAEPSRRVPTPQTPNRPQPPPGNICVYCPGGPDSDFEYSTQVGPPPSIPPSIRTASLIPNDSIPVTSPLRTTHPPACHSAFAIRHPQSYTGYEPTSMRAIRARYNPYVQARGRVDQLRRLGHNVDKV